MPESNAISSSGGDAPSQDAASTSASNSRDAASSAWNRYQKQQQQHHRKHEPSIANITNRTDSDSPSLSPLDMVSCTSSTSTMATGPSPSTPSNTAVAIATVPPSLTPSSAPPHASDDSAPRKRKKMARTRTGCLNCRRRKRKCDEGRPSCIACNRRQETCEWGVKLTFRAENSLSILQSHPSMCKGLKRPRTYEILDVRDEVIRDYHLHMPASPDVASDYDSDDHHSAGGAPADRALKKHKHHEEARHQSQSQAQAQAQAQAQIHSQSQPQQLPEEPTGSHQHTTPKQRYKLPALLSPNRSHSHALAYNTHGQHGDTSFVPSPLSLPTVGHSHPNSHSPHPHPQQSHSACGFPSPVGHSASLYVLPDDRQPVPPSTLNKPAPELSSHDRPSAPGPAISPRSAKTSPLSAQQRLTESAVANLLYLSRGGPSPPVSHVASSTASDNNPLCHTHSQNMSPVAAGAMRIGLTPPATEATQVKEQQLYSTESYHGDGIFVPGSVYLDLHSLLRHHLFRESQSAHRTRAGTPATPQPIRSSHGSFNDSAAVNLPSPIALEQAPAQTAAFSLSPNEEGKLWKNWVEEIAPWMDKFDCDRTFGHILPAMTRLNEHLKYAMLSLSARQLEQANPGDSGLSPNLSLNLYRQAVYSLLPQLSKRTTAVLASCVILSIFEMLSCNPKMWKRHMDGCASLLEAIGTNGFVGGVEQALFWVFARMDVGGSIISCTKPLIPVHQWASKTDLDADVGLFRSSNSTRGFGEWANYAVYLTAQVLDLLAVTLLEDTGSVAGPRASFSDGSTRSDSEFRNCWTKLWAYLEDWQAQRPAELQKIMCIPGSEHSPFPTIIYSNMTAMSGNQLYHTASLLMLQHKPATVKLSPKSRSALWHARQICGISMSNDLHSVWISSVQPLWIAGRCMSHPAEHKAILDLLGKIERTCGLATEWRANDLRELWGDLEE
ncbi:Transcription activator AMTR1 [Ceratocystis lukuohia]|uniref:Transcription activator AMTR1 n=1 Tax=Ceratocystis lukuohia TaxID=2019550 RepID=A0ABR4MA10_9PEZI